MKTDNDAYVAPDFQIFEIGKGSIIATSGTTGNSSTEGLEEEDFLLW